MLFSPKTLQLFVFAVFFSLFINVLAPVVSFADETDFRTSERSVLARPTYPDFIFTKPPHYEFSPLVSNYQPQHPADEAGQGWETSQWNSKWIPEVAIRKFFQARIFEQAYIFRGQIPVLELGPTFYQLSDIDQRRTLDLLISKSAIFKRGYSVVKLADWYTHDFVGSYTSAGMFLD